MSTSETITDVAAAARAAKALRMRALGATYQKIADECPYGSRAAAYHAVQRELKRNLIEASEDVRQLELYRLDVLLTSMMRKAVTGDVQAARRCLDIMERRAKYLGLDIGEREQTREMPIIREYPEGVAAAV